MKIVPVFRFLDNVQGEDNCLSLDENLLTWYRVWYTKKRRVSHYEL